MAHIKPFRGILYNKEKVDIAKVIAPPYDVISPETQESLYKNDEHNIVRLILGKKERFDTSYRNRYSRSAAFLAEWLKNKILVRDARPAIYICQETYLHRGKKITRLGFIALMKIEDPKKSGVLPHEYTLAKPKKDRLNLIIKTKANLSPIFSLFQDKENKVNKILKVFIKGKKPIFTVDEKGVAHKMWRMEDAAAISKIKGLMHDKKIFIADGHHRYEVALTYRDRMRKSRAFNKNADYVMMYFSNLSEKRSLTILSTHRVVKNIPNFKEEGLPPGLEEYFFTQNSNSLRDIIEKVEKAPRNKRTFGMYTRRMGFYLLTLKKARLKKLDVAILHDLIINKILGVNNPENSIKYVRNEKDAVTLVDKGEYEVSFFLRPAAVSDMQSLAEKGEMMPQKSTYFYPKPLSGLVVNKF